MRTRIRGRRAVPRLSISFFFALPLTVVLSLPLAGQEPATAEPLAAFRGLPWGSAPNAARERESGPPVFESDEAFAVRKV